MSMRIDGTNTTANPGITGADTDTGLQFGTNEVSIVTDGEEQVKVDSGGRVLFEKAVRFQYNTDSTDSRTWMLSNDVHSNGDFAFRRSDAQTSTSFDTKILFKDSGGICFNGDTAAANALDDYEEGTWTPNIGGTATYNIQWGYYVKVGAMVHCWGGLRPNSMGTGNARQIRGLPFTALDSPSSTQTGGGAVVWHDNAPDNLINTPSIAITPNSTTAYINTKTSGAGNLQDTTDFWQNNHRANFFITYRITL